jgi:hypothetical protein
VLIAIFAHFGAVIKWNPVLIVQRERDTTEDATELANLNGRINLKLER